MIQRPAFYELSIKDLQLSNLLVDSLERRGISSIGALFTEVANDWPALKRSLGLAATELAGAFRDLQRKVSD